MEDNRNIRCSWLTPKSVANLVTAHIGEIQIEKNRIYRFAQSQFKASIPCSGVKCIKPRERQKLRKSLSVSLIVVDDKHSNGRHGGWPMGHTNHSTALQFSRYCEHLSSQIQHLLSFLHQLGESIFLCNASFSLCSLTLGAI
jgi:hypothetical protein